MTEIGVRYSGGVTVIVPQGSITTSGVEGLRAALSGEPKGHGIVILTRGGWNTCARRRQRCLFWRCRSQICSRRRAWQPPEDRWKC